MKALMHLIIWALCVFLSSTLFYVALAILMCTPFFSMWAFLGILLIGLSAIGLVFATKSMINMFEILDIF